MDLLSRRKLKDRSVTFDGYICTDPSPGLDGRLTLADPPPSYSYESVFMEDPCDQSKCLGHLGTTRTIFLKLEL